MGESIARRRAKIYFYLLALLFLIVQMLFLSDVEVVGNEDVLGGIGLTCLFLIFIVLTIKGFNWARWVLTILLLIFGLLFLFAGFEIPSLKLKIVGLYYLLFGLLPHFSKRLKPIVILQIKDDDNAVQSEPHHLLVNGKAHEFPYLIDRYKAMLIDGLLLLVLMTICVQVKSVLDPDSMWLLIVYILFLFLYEPVLVTHSSTIGQRIMKIRVRSIDEPNDRINLGKSYVRFLTKALLGWLSFVTISFNKERRAIHDMIASSVVIKL